MGWVGILSTIPVVTFCRWHRTLLFLAGTTQCAAPLVRYLGATSVPVALGTQFLMGAAFGVIGAWPAMLARLQVGTQTHSLQDSVRVGLAETQHRCYYSPTDRLDTSVTFLSHQ